MADPIRIAVVGPAGSGKSALARRCQKAWGGDVLSFATPLKKVTRELYGELMDDPAFARTANQEIGAAARKVDDQVWVRILLAKVSPDRPCYVDDARFYNEYQALHLLGFVTVKLLCADAVLAERRPEMTPEQRRHQSETEAMYIRGDFTVGTNDNDLEIAYDQLVHGVEALRPGWAIKKKAPHGPISA